MSVNKVILMGNVGKDPEYKDFDNGGSVAQFTLATTEEHLKRQMVQKYRSAPNGTILFCKMDWQRLQKSM